MDMSRFNIERYNKLQDPETDNIIYKVRKHKSVTNLPTNKNRYFKNVTKKINDSLPIKVYNVTITLPGTSTIPGMLTTTTTGINYTGDVKQRQQRIKNPFKQQHLTIVKRPGMLRIKLRVKHNV